MCYSGYVDCYLLEGADMNYCKNQPQMTLSDRLAIEVGIERKESFKAIAKVLHKTTGSVKKRYERALSKLRTKIK